MNALAGIYSRTGRPIERQWLLDLSSGLADFGPDGEHFLFSEPLAIVQRSFETEHIPSIPPAASSTHDGYILSLSGRIDNMSDLYRESPLAHRDPVSCLLSRYRSRGVAGFAQVVGEFLLVLWDPLEQRIILICDPLGRHVLYYHITHDFLFWSSRPRVLLPFTHSAGAPSAEYMADFLTNRASDVTPYHSIDKVPAGHALAVWSTGQSTQRYWALRTNHTILYKSDREYEERFLDLFTEAVACRMNTAAPVFCELSGGLDSSSIACIAKAVSVRGGRKPVQTVSYTFPSAPTSDESEYIRPMVRMLDLHHVDISDSDCPILAPLEGISNVDLPTNDLAFITRHDRLADIMRQSRSRVVLNGMGGDQLFWSTPHVFLPLLDSIERRTVPEFLRRTGVCSRITGANYLLVLALSLKAAISYRKRSLPCGRGGAIGDWFHPGFVKSTALKRRASPLLDDDVGIFLPSDAYKYALIRRTMRDFALQRVVGRQYVVNRYPYLDQRLVEFSMALPFEQSVRWPETRSIVRRAFKDLLPPRIVGRTTKAGPSEACLRALVHQWPRILKESPTLKLEEYGIVEPRRFLRAVELARLGMVTHSAQLLSTISLELWLRSIGKRFAVNEAHHRTDEFVFPREGNSVSSITGRHIH